MKKIINTVLLVSGFIFFLSIQIDGRPIFGHIYHAIYPTTSKVQDVVVDSLQTILMRTKMISQKLFQNSIPKSSLLKDTVNSQLAGHKKMQGPERGKPLEIIEPKEKEELDELIKSSSSSKKLHLNF